MNGIFEDPRLKDGTAPKWFQYIFNLGLHMSQGISVILGGDPDESISSRTHKAAETGHWWFKMYQEPFINWLMGDKDHCKNALEPEEGAKQIWTWGKNDK